MFYYQLKSLLIDEILAGTYGADGKIPTEQALCQRFGLSRTPVTRALSELAAEGVVLRRRRHGTIVNPEWLRRRAAAAELRVLVARWDRWRERLRSVAPADMRLSFQVAGEGELHSAFTRAVAEGRAPDLAALDSIWIAEFAAAGALWPLEELDPEWMTSEFRRDFLPPFVRAHRVGGSTFAVQAEMDLGGVWYDRERLGAGIPTTWAELHEAGRRLRHALVLPFGPSGRGGWNTSDEFITYCLVNLLAANGARVLRPGGVALASKEAMDALTMLRVLADNGVLADSGWNRSVELLATGEAAMMLGSTWQLPALADKAALSAAEAASTFAFAPLPSGPRGAGSVLVGGFAYCVPRQSRQPERAMDLLRRAVDGAALAGSYLRTGLLPPHRSVAEFGAGLLADAVTRPVTPVYPLVSRQLRELARTVVSGELEPGIALGRAADRIAAITDLPLLPG